MTQTGKLTQQQLERHLWSAAEILRGKIDSALLELARFIDELYASDETAPPGWTSKDQLRKDLRQQVRRRAHRVGGFPDLFDLTHRVDVFARDHYAKIGD